MTRSARTPPPTWWEIGPAPMVPGATAYRGKVSDGTLTVIAGQEPDGWHMSISHSSRYPSWDEITDARYRYMPGDITAAMLLPPEAEYVNVHDRCFHLWEVA